MDITNESLLLFIQTLRADKKAGQRFRQFAGKFDLFKDDKVEKALSEEFHKLALVGILEGPLTGVMSAYASGFLMALMYMESRKEIEELEKIEKLGEMESK